MVYKGHSIPLSLHLSHQPSFCDANPGPGVTDSNATPRAVDLRPSTVFSRLVKGAEELQRLLPSALIREGAEHHVASSHTQRLSAS